MADITYCCYAECPFKDCERHLSKVTESGRAQAVWMADFAPTCRRYIAHVVEEVADNG